MSNISYSIEVEMNPRKGKDKIFWVIWRITEDDKTNVDCGWASSPAEAWITAFEHRDRIVGNTITNKNGIRECYQVAYTLTNYSGYHGHVFENRDDAISYANTVNCVAVNGKALDVLSFRIEPKTFVPHRKRR